MKESCVSRIYWFLRIFFLILLFTLIWFVAFRIPKFATETFGQADETLSDGKQIYLAALLLYQRDNLITPKKYFGEDVLFQVGLGESAFSISQRLKDSGLIANPGIFRSYLVYCGIDTKIQAGDYLLNPMMTPIDIAWELQDATPAFVDFTILAGWRSEEIAVAIPYSGLEFSPDEFMGVIRSSNLEGYLLPGNYTFSRETSPEVMVDAIMDTFNSSLTEEMIAGFNAQGLSIREALILASIIEREAIVEDEMPLMASVFLNRLNLGMTLDADPTVQYALGYNSEQESWWTNPLSADDLAVVSPYNTYLYPGLPPGPICNPGINALKAVAFSAQTPYLYFRVSCDGSNLHIFSETLAEHIDNACP
jgi:UPF0755 protein